ncbi:MAG: DNA alkylation repair protein [Candidatus Diapherotrites archaeon]|nr:DNA alkylation repair protein [Candidatus Diapherotrites archaeon]
MDTFEKILKTLRSMANPKNVEGMKRFGINPKGTLGVSIYDLRPFAKELGTDHKLAVALWKTGIHEARLLAGMAGDPGLVSEKQFEEWVSDFDSWDVVDQTCSNLFDKTPFAWQKAVELCSRKEEFVKRTGFVLMACLSVHDKSAKDKDFEKFFPLIVRESGDERNFVKKAVNWALRQIGKRNLRLNKRAVAVAREIQKLGSKPGRWIAADALRELQSEKTLKRLRERKIKMG